MQHVLLGLLLIDVLIVGATLTLEELLKSPNAHHIENTLRWMSVAILSCFVLEIICLLIAFGWHFFTHILHVLDAILVVGSLVMEAVLDLEALGLLIVARFWRVLRVVHGVYMETKQSEDNLRSELQQARQEIDQLRLALNLPVRYSVRPVNDAQLQQPLLAAARSNGQHQPELASPCVVS